MLRINGQMSSAHIEAHELVNYIGKRVSIHGMIYKIREMSGFAFVLLQTKSMMLQCVYEPETAQFALHTLAENMSVVFGGEVSAEPRSKMGFELKIIDVSVLSRPKCEPPVPINGKEISAGIETLLDFRQITMRNAKERAIFKVQSGICSAFREFFKKEQFTEIHSPKIVSGSAEGGANIFELDYFGKQAYLSQSPQFYKQMMVGVFERVYEIAPVFRAEKHDTSRHINEYTSVDFEMGFIESFYDIMQMEIKMLTHTMEFLSEYCADELLLLSAKLPRTREIPHIEFCEAKELVARTYKREITDEDDFEPEEEKLLCEIVEKSEGSEFVFVTHYKSKKRPFYAMDSVNNNAVTESFDLLFRGMEITTGGQRIHGYDEQLAKMHARGMNTEPFLDYLMTHKCGLPPHGGLGLGLERFTAKLLGFQNVRRATLFPRDTGRLNP